MNDCCSSTPIQPPATPEKGFLQRLINTGGMISVDLTDAIFAAMPRREGAPYEAIVKSNCSE